MQTPSLPSLARACILALVVMTAGCGGEPRVEPTTVADANTATGAEASTAGAAGTTGAVPAKAGAAPGTGVIEIGALRRDLVVKRCMTMAGALGADAVAADGTGNLKVRFDFSPADWRERSASEGWAETGSISLRADEPYLQWESGPSVIAGYNLRGTDPASLAIIVLEMSEERRRARGTARFLDVNALMRGEVVTTEGRFEFTCPAS